MRRIRVEGEPLTEFLGLSAPVAGFGNPTSSSVIVMNEEEELTHEGMTAWQKMYPKSGFYAIQPRGWGYWRWAPGVAPAPQCLTALPC